MTTHTAPRLIRRSPSSFTLDQTLPETFAAWLEDHRFHRRATSRSLVEHSRWERSQRLVILYTSGAIVVAGPQPAPCIKLLATLVAAETAVTP